MGLTLGSIGGSNLGSSGDSKKESLQGFQCLGVVAIHTPVVVVVWIKFETHFSKFKTKVRTIYLAAAADLFLPNSPRSSFQPNRTNRINKRMTALANAKSTLSSAIDTVTKPYADVTAIMQDLSADLSMF